MESRLVVAQVWELEQGMIANDGQKDYDAENVEMLYCIDCAILNLLSHLTVHLK